MNDQLHVFIGKTQAYHIADILEHQSQIILRYGSLHLAGLYLRKVQYAVYDGKQRVAGVTDIICILLNMAVDVIVKYQLGHAYDGIHGRPYLVAHVGQEYGLCLVGRLRLVLKAGKPFGKFMLLCLIIYPYGCAFVSILIIKRHERDQIMLISYDDLMMVARFKLFGNALLSGVIIQLREDLPGFFIYKKDPVHGIHHDEALFYGLYNIVSGHYHRIKHAVAEYQRSHQRPAYHNKEAGKRIGQIIFKPELQHRSQRRDQLSKSQPARAFVCLYHFVQIITEGNVKAKNGYEYQYRNIYV